MVSGSVLCRAMVVAFGCVCGALTSACIVRDSSYSALLARYHRAVPLCALSTDQAVSAERAAEVRLSNGVKVLVSAGPGNSELYVQFSDEGHRRRVSAGHDYPVVRQVRIDGGRLYAFVSYVLLWTDNWVFEYDIVARKALESRKVAVGDVNDARAPKCIE